MRHWVSVDEVSNRNSLQSLATTVSGDSGCEGRLTAAAVFCGINNQLVLAENKPETFHPTVFFEAYLLKTSDDQWKALWSLLICKREWLDARNIWPKFTRQETCRQSDRCSVLRSGLRLRPLFAARVDIVTVSTGVIPHQWQTIQLLNRFVRP